MADQATKGMSRRKVLTHGAAAGAVIWTVPMVMSNTAKATGGGGSNGAILEGRLDSVTCVWIDGYFRRAQGTSGQPQHDYSNDAFCEINVGDGWKTIARNEPFTIPFGRVLNFQPWTGHSGTRSAEPIDDSTQTPAPVDETTTTTDETTTTTAAPTTTVAGVPNVEDNKPADVPPAEATTTTAPAPLPLEPAAADMVDTIVIDMSGRTDINIGDVYGYFQIVDAVPA